MADRRGSLVDREYYHCQLDRTWQMDEALKEKSRQLYMALGSNVSAPDSEPPTPTLIDATSLEVEEIKI